MDHFVDNFKRSFLKVKGEGTTQEILEIFAGSYRATPNTNAPHGNSLADTLMNRKVVELPGQHVLAKDDRNSKEK